MKKINNQWYTDKQYIELLEDKYKKLLSDYRYLADKYQCDIYLNDIKELEESNNSLRIRLINTEQRYLELKEQSFSGNYIDRVKKAIEKLKNTLNTEEPVLVEYEIETLVDILEGNENE